MNKQITKTFSVLRDVPAELQTADEGMWAIATCEVTDAMGDIVRSEGVTWKEYHHPPQRHLKLLANHLRVLPNGESPVIGRVEEFKRTSLVEDGQVCKALAFRFTFAKDGAGAYTPLAEGYKKLFDGGYMDSFSVGMLVNEYEQMKEGGLDITKASLFEISAVSIPALPQANAIKRELKELGYEFEDQQQPVQIEFDDSSNGRCVETLRGADGKYRRYVRAVDHDAIVDEVVAKASEPHTVHGLVEGLVKSVDGVQTLLAGLADRIETIESSVEVLTHTRTTPGEDQHNDDEATRASLARLNEQFDRTLKFLGR